MKKLLITVSIIVSIIIFFVVYFNWVTPVKEFDLEDYSYEIEEMPFSFFTERFPEISEPVPQPISSAREAVSFARKTWRLYNKFYSSQKGPFQVYFDSENNAWHVHSSPLPMTVGGTAGILIDGKTGEIIAMWYEK